MLAAFGERKGIKREGKLDGYPMFRGLRLLDQAERVRRERAAAPAEARGAK